MVGARTGARAPATVWVGPNRTRLISSLPYFYTFVMVTLTHFLSRHRLATQNTDLNCNLAKRTHLNVQCHQEVNHHYTTDWTDSLQRRPLNVAFYKDPRNWLHQSLSIKRFQEIGLMHKVSEPSKSADHNHWNVTTAPAGPVFITARKDKL